MLPAGDSCGLDQLRAAILAADPLTTKRFITRPVIAALLSDMPTAQLPPTHATLEQADASLQGCGQHHIDDWVAAALVVLYAQTLNRIVALSTEHIHRDGETVSLQLGSDRLELAAPFATLIQSLPLRRRRGIGEQLPTSWLFPGGHAGRPLRAVALGNRLRDLGIQPQHMRLAALDQPTKMVPPAMLACVLGISARTTVSNTTRAGGDWARYAAGRHT